MQDFHRALAVFSENIAPGFFGNLEQVEGFVSEMVITADIAAPIVADPRDRAYPRAFAAVVDELAVEFLRGRGKSRGAKKRGERDESFGLRRSRAFSRKRRGGMKFRPPAFYDSLSFSLLLQIWKKAKIDRGFRGVKLFSRKSVRAVGRRFSR